MFKVVCICPHSLQLAQLFPLSIVLGDIVVSERLSYNIKV